MKLGKRALKVESRLCSVLASLRRAHEPSNFLQAFGDKWPQFGKPRCARKTVTNVPKRNAMLCDAIAMLCDAFIYRSATPAKAA